MMTWSEAKDHCMKINQELATFTKDEMKYFNGQDFPIWIGLHRHGKNKTLKYDLKMITDYQ